MGSLTILLLIPYFLMTIGLLTVAMRRGMRFPGFAFLPVGMGYILGRIADLYILQWKRKKTYYAVFLPVLQAIYIVMLIISVTYVTSNLAGMVTLQVVSIVSQVLMLVTLCYLYEWNSEHAIALAIASVLGLVSSLFMVPLVNMVLISILVFAIRNGDNPKLYTSAETACSERAEEP